MPPSESVYRREKEARARFGSGWRQKFSVVWPATTWQHITVELHFGAQILVLQKSFLKDIHAC